MNNQDLNQLEKDLGLDELKSAIKQDLENEFGSQFESFAKKLRTDIYSLFKTKELKQPETKVDEPSADELLKSKILKWKDKN